MRIRSTLTIAVIIFFSGSCIAQINVSDGQTAAALAGKLAGQGVTILNPTLNCPSNANGFFSVVSSNLGLDSGIVLTNGQANTVGTIYGVNGPQSEFANKNNGVGGDAALSSLTGGLGTFDACDLEFDVIPTGDTISFNYVFSSEEYEKAVCGSFNDIFVFFISGPGIATYDNMALVPGTNIPVAINSINDSVPGPRLDFSNCSRMGAGSPFPKYYKDNTAGATLTHFGLTTVLQAKHDVIPCNKYHLKIEIVDVDDPIYDSGVFLEAGSLQATNFHVNALTSVIHDTASAVCVKGCLPGAFSVKCSHTSTQPQTVHFLLQGSAVAGYDYAPIADSVIIPSGSTSTNITVTGLPTPLYGPKVLQLYLKAANNCAAGNNFIDSATMTVYDSPYVFFSPADTFICGSDRVTMHPRADDIYNCHWTPPYNISDTAVLSPLVYPAADTAYTLTISLPGTACPEKSAQVHFKVRSAPQLSVRADTTVCYHAFVHVRPVIFNPNPFFSYMWNGPAGYVSDSASLALDTVTGAQEGNYVLTVTDDTNSCKATGTMSLAVITPDTPVVSVLQQFCINKDTTGLTASGIDLLWYTNIATDSGSTVAPTVPVTYAGTHIYYVTQTVGGCESPKIAVRAQVEQCCNGNIFIPSAFTPNGTGINRTFNVFPDYGYYIKSFMVFNRWGQLVYSSNKAGWDGTYMGYTAEMGTYFYSITFGCVLGGEVTRNGDVTLVR